MVGVMKSRLMGLVLSSVAASVLAQSGSLADPTRPPPAFVGEADPGSGGDAKALVLQSVIMPKGGRPSAVISGRTYPLGSAVGDGKLVRIGEMDVTIQGSGGSQNLSLTPDVEKTVVREKGARTVLWKKKE